MAKSAGDGATTDRPERAVVIVLVALVIIGATGYLRGWSQGPEPGDISADIAGQVPVAADTDIAAGEPVGAPASSPAAVADISQSGAAAPAPQTDSVVLSDQSEVPQAELVAPSDQAEEGQADLAALSGQSGQVGSDLAVAADAPTDDGVSEPSSDVTALPVEPEAEALISTAPAIAEATSETGMNTEESSSVAEASEDVAALRSPEATPLVAPDDLAMPDTSTGETPTTQAPATPETAPVAADAPGVVAPETAPPDALRFDLVRVEADGSAILAGRAKPGAEVTVLLDGTPKATAVAGPDGKFAALFTVAPSIAPQQVALLAEGADGPLRGAETLIIAPSPQPVVQPADVATGPKINPPTETTDLKPVVDPAVERAPAAAPRLLLADDDGVRVVQAAPAGQPSAQTSVSIDAISYEADGAVVLSGRGAGAIRVYLDNQAVQTVPVAEDGQWRTPLPSVDTGVYTLRVDALDAEGRVTARVQTPFQREEPTRIAALAAERQTVPAGPHVITVQPGSTLWGIARAEYGRGILFVRVFEANRDTIADPHWIYPGQVFEVPEATIDENDTP